MMFHCHASLYHYSRSDGQHCAARCLACHRPPSRHLPLHKTEHFNGWVWHIALWSFRYTWAGSARREALHGKQFALPKTCRNKIFSFSTSPCSNYRWIKNWRNIIQRSCLPQQSLTKNPCQRRGTLLEYITWHMKQVCTMLCAHEKEQVQHFGHAMCD